jgi:tetratricopeptide (TPR) repeat protein
MIDHFSLQMTYPAVAQLINILTGLENLPSDSLYSTCQSLYVYAMPAWFNYICLNLISVILMMRLFFSAFLIFAVLTSCTQQKETPLSDSQKINITVQRMNGRALELLKGYNPDTTLIKQSLTILDSALIIKPNYPTALHNKYKLHYQLNDIAGMLKTNEMIIRHNPIEPEYLIHRAKIFELLNEPDSVSKYYEKGLKAYEAAFKMIGESSVPWQLKLQYAESLAFAGHVEEANEILKMIKLFYLHEPYLKDWKLRRTYEEWMDSWYFSNDGTDYINQDI